MSSSYLPPISFDNDNAYTDRRKIGKLIITNKVIAKGSDGTIVFEGNYDGLLVAVKRLVQTHHDVAVKEIQNLIASDQHPNIVRWYGVEYDQDFVYLSLGRCTCSLHEFVSSYTSRNQIAAWDQGCVFPIFSNGNMQLLWALESSKEFDLWETNGYPSAWMLKLMKPTAVEALHHPMFWNSETRLSFLRDVSDRVELEDRENTSQLLEALESRGGVYFGDKWDEKMDSAVINDIGRYRRHKFDSVRDYVSYEIS